MFRPLVTLVFLVVIGLAMMFVEGPGLMRDFQLRNTALVPALGLKVEEATCRVHWWIVSNCSVSYSGPQQRERKSISFSVFGTLGGERVQLLRTADGRTVTTDVGLARLTNRITTALFLLLGLAGAGFLAARRAIEAA